MMNFRKKAKNFMDAPLSRQVVMEMLKDYKRPNDKISELIRNGELLSVRRGLYVPGPNADLPVPDPFLIANHLRGPSYVSLETALSYWGFIPERVYEISSVTMKTSKIYKTDAGRFSYQHAPSPYYSFGIRSVELKERQVALIASPEKAVCDKIVMTSGIALRSIRQTLDFLVEDMRMDETLLRKLNAKIIASWMEDAPKKSSLRNLVKTLDTL